jgi:hypothetical protein
VCGPSSHSTRTPGFNLDFEIGVRCPTCKGPENATKEDARGLARFIDQLASALEASAPRRVPKRTVSIDMMTWGQPLWNHHLLSKSKLGRAVDMSTYGNARGDPADFREFVVSTGLMLEQYDCNQIGIGFCPACLNKSRPFTEAQIGARFALVCRRPHLLPPPPLALAYRFVTNYALRPAPADGLSVSATPTFT